MAQYGVNLGGWFIPEKWMTPALFDGLDVHDTVGLFESEEGVRRYNVHVRTFIKQKDIDFLIQRDVTLLRVPVAWWMVSDEYGELQRICRERLDWLFRYAKDNNLRILLDFHAARGSQNGKDHSGAVGPVNWRRHYAKNLLYLTTFAKRYGKSSALWGIELINEPVVRGQFWFLSRYNRTAKKQLKDILSSRVKIVIHDGFVPLLFSHIAPWRSSIVLDLHLYEIPVKPGESIHDYFQRRDKKYGRRIRWLQRFQPVIVGEWSGVIPAIFLKGLSEKEKEAYIMENITRQRALYEQADAWMFWSFTTNDPLMWNFEKVLRSPR